MKKRSILPFLLFGVGAMLILFALFFSTKPKAEIQAPQTLISEEENFPEIQRVTTEDALIAFQGGSAVFIDVRDTDSYNNSHIPGAQSFPLAQLEEQLRILDTDTWIITYCT